MMQSGPADVEVRAGGRRLMARWFAPRLSPDHPAIVLLHQGLGSITQWRDFPDRLARATGLAVVGYDRHGHGRSAPLEGPRRADFLEREAADVLPQVLEALGIDRPVLYGHSDGGTVALQFAATYPERPLAAISEAGHVFSEVHETGGIAAAREAFRSGLREKLARHHGDKVDAMFHGWADVWTSPAMRGWQMLDRLAAITCPVLVVQGEDDEHGTAAQVEAIVGRVRGPVFAELIPSCGHMPHLEAGERVAARVAAFLRETGTAGHVGPHQAVMPPSTV